MLGPSSHRPRPAATMTTRSLQLAAVAGVGLSIGTHAHAAAQINTRAVAALGEARTITVSTAPAEVQRVGVGIALHAAGDVARRSSQAEGRHARRPSPRLDHRRGEDCDRPGRGRERGRGRHRGSGPDDDLSGVAAIGAGVAICAFGLLVPLGEPEHTQSPDWDGDGWPDDRWDDDRSDDWRDGSYNAANVLLVALGGGLMAWGVHIETQSRHRSFALAPSFKPDGTARGIETGLVASVRF